MAFSISESFNITGNPTLAHVITGNPTFAHVSKHKEKLFDVICFLYKITISLIAMRSKEMWLVLENHVSVKLDSKMYSESKIELQNLQILKKMLEESSQSLSYSSFMSWKLGCCLEYCRSWKNTLSTESLWFWSILEAIRFEFKMKGALVMVDVCVFCGLWFSNLFDIVSETSHSCDTVGREL